MFFFHGNIKLKITRISVIRGTNFGIITENNGYFSIFSATAQLTCFKLIIVRCLPGSLWRSLSPPSLPSVCGLLNTSRESEK